MGERKWTEEEDPVDCGLRDSDSSVSVGMEDPEERTQGPGKKEGYDYLIYVTRSESS